MTYPESPSMTAERAGGEQSPLLSVRNLKTYFYQDEGVTKAVDGVSFDVFPRQTVGIVGESGCGKSVTSLSILRIVDRPGRLVDGEIRIRQNYGTADEREIDIAKLAPNGKELRYIRGGEIGLVFQEPMSSLSPVHTIGNQLIESLRLHTDMTAEQARERAIELLRLVGISQPEQRIDAYTAQLSGGLRQRAMIAIALACNPKLLIADEPTTALDVTTQAQILDLLRSIQEKTGMAVMLITHDLGVIAETCDYVLVMYLGRVIEKGPVDDIFFDPKHPYTKALLRSIPSVHAEPKTRLPALSGSVPHPFNRPKGCPFHPRCPDFMPGKCDLAEPALAPVGERHEASCFLYPGS